MERMHRGSVSLNPCRWRTLDRPSGALGPSAVSATPPPPRRATKTHPHTSPPPSLPCPQPPTPKQSVTQVLAQRLSDPFAIPPACQTEASAVGQLLLGLPRGTGKCDEEVPHTKWTWDVGGHTVSQSYPGIGG